MGLYHPSQASSQWKKSQNTEHGWDISTMLQQNRPSAIFTTQTCSFPAQFQLYVTSDVFVSGVKLWRFPTQMWSSLGRVRALVFHSVYCHRSLEIWGKPAKITCMKRQKALRTTFEGGNFKVWHLKHRRLRSRKLKFGQGNFKVWHPKHRHLTSRENLFLEQAFTGRCNRHYLGLQINAIAPLWVKAQRIRFSVLQHQGHSLPSNVFARPCHSFSFSFKAIL